MHKPVMLEQAMDALITDRDGTYIDATLGRGGHSRAILERCEGLARVCGFDKDPAAVEFCQQEFSNDNVAVVHASYSQLISGFSSLSWDKEVDGVLFDLGVSSPQLDQAERGFSFMRAGPLDMRMDNSAGITAQEWLLTVRAGELERVLRDYGEERYAGRVARAIIARRAKQPFVETTDLAETIKAAIPNWQPGRHPATRSFQGIRMHINNELEELRWGVEQAISMLKPGARLVVISFHSGEDKIVKKTIQKYCRGNEDLSGEPKEILLRKIGKAQYADHIEIVENQRSRSAVMRVAEKLPEDQQQRSC